MASELLKDLKPGMLRAMRDAAANRVAARVAQNTTPYWGDVMDYVNARDALTEALTKKRKKK